MRHPITNPRNRKTSRSSLGMDSTNELTPDDGHVSPMKTRASMSTPNTPKSDTLTSPPDTSRIKTQQPTTKSTPVSLPKSLPVTTQKGTPNTGDVKTNQITTKSTPLSISKSLPAIIPKRTPTTTPATSLPSMISKSLVSSESNLSPLSSPKFTSTNSSQESPTNSAILKRHSNIENEFEDQPPKRRKIGKNNGTGNDNQNDYYCWNCHREGSVVCCELCPRVFHMKCLGITRDLPENWVCPECEKTMRAECLDTRSKAMSMISTEQLCQLLKFCLNRMTFPGSEPFQKPVDQCSVTTYSDYVFNPVDLRMLERNIKRKKYGSTEAFMADAKWILHNCVIFNGPQHKLSAVARAIVKICKHETNEIEICPDCYLNSCIKQNDVWFCEPCRTPHTLVYAKLKGYPFWPAKALREQDGQIDVRFFGAHDRSWVPVSQVFLLSKDIPTPLRKNRSGFDSSMQELKLHITKIRERFGSFEYAPFRTPYDRKSVYFNDKPRNKEKIRKKVTPAVTTTVTNIASDDLKKRKKEIALKMKYNSIITTRRAANKEETKTNIFETVTDLKKEFSPIKQKSKIALGKKETVDIVGKIAKTLHQEGTVAMEVDPVDDVDGDQNKAVGEVSDDNIHDKKDVNKKGDNASKVLEKTSKIEADANITKLSEVLDDLASFSGNVDCGKDDQNDENSDKKSSIANSTPDKKISISNLKAKYNSTLQRTIDNCKAKLNISDEDVDSTTMDLLSDDDEISFKVAKEESDSEDVLSSSDKLSSKSGFDSLDDLLDINIDLQDSQLSVEVSSLESEGREARDDDDNFKSEVAVSQQSVEADSLQSEDKERGGDHCSDKDEMVVCHQPVEAECLESETQENHNTIKNVSEVCQQSVKANSLENKNGNGQEVHNNVKNMTEVSKSVEVKNNHHREVEERLENSKSDAVVCQQSLRAPSLANKDQEDQANDSNVKSMSVDSEQCVQAERKNLESPDKHDILESETVVCQQAVEALGAECEDREGQADLNNVKKETVVFPQSVEAESKKEETRESCDIFKSETVVAPKSSETCSLNNENREFGTDRTNVKIMTLDNLEDQPVVSNCKSIDKSPENDIQRSLSKPCPTTDDHYVKEIDELCVDEIQKAVNIVSRDHSKVEQTTNCDNQQDGAGTNNRSQNDQGAMVEKLDGLDNSSNIGDMNDVGALIGDSTENDVEMTNVNADILIKNTEKNSKNERVLDTEAEKETIESQVKGQIGSDIAASNEVKDGDVFGCHKDKGDCEQKDRKLIISDKSINAIKSILKKDDIYKVLKEKTFLTKSNMIDNDSLNSETQVTQKGEEKVSESELGSCQNPNVDYKNMVIEDILETKENSKDMLISNEQLNNGAEEMDCDEVSPSHRDLVIDIPDTDKDLEPQRCDKKSEDKNSLSNSKSDESPNLFTSLTKTLTDSQNVKNYVASLFEEGFGKNKQNETGVGLSTSKLSTSRTDLNKMEETVNNITNFVAPPNSLTCGLQKDKNIITQNIIENQIQSTNVLTTIARTTSSLSYSTVTSDFKVSSKITGVTAPQHHSTSKSIVISPATAAPLLNPLGSGKIVDQEMLVSTSQTQSSTDTKFVTESTLQSPMLMSPTSSSTTATKVMTSQSSVSNTPGIFTKEPVSTSMTLDSSKTKISIDIRKYQDKFVNLLTETVKSIYDDVSQQSKDTTSLDETKKEITELKRQHKAEICELWHNIEQNTAEMKNIWQKQEKKLREDFEANYKVDKEMAVKATKLKQWCANCQKEALFYCCWNTSYCDYKCQLAHWPEHMKNCTQQNESSVQTVPGATTELSPQVVVTMPNMAGNQNSYLNPNTQHVVPQVTHLQTARYDNNLHVMKTRLPTSPTFTQNTKNTAVPRHVVMYPVRTPNLQHRAIQPTHMFSLPPNQTVTQIPQSGLNTRKTMLPTTIMMPPQFTVPPFN